MTILIAILIALAIDGVCLLKGKRNMALLGFLLSPLISLPGAVRLAKPGSWWSRKFYGHAKLRRSWERFQRTPYTPTGEEVSR